MYINLIVKKEFVNYCMELDDDIGQSKPQTLIWSEIKLSSLVLVLILFEKKGLLIQVIGIYDSW